jgi:hypothetical protein
VIAGPVPSPPIQGAIRCMASLPKRAVKVPLRDPAEEQRAVLLEGRRVQRFVVVARKMELDRLQPSLRHAQPQPLDHEGRVVGLEPVLLALADHEPATVGRALERQQEEAEGRRVHDLGAVVEDPSLAVDLVAVLAHRNRIVGRAAGLDNATPTMSTFGVRRG